MVIASSAALRKSRELATHDAFAPKLQTEVTINPRRD